jgi:DNA-binding transcriptional ArsR family regulator
MHIADIDRAFHALADASRREFIHRLASRSMSVSELAAGSRLTLAAVVQHVQVLQAGGLITTHKSGRVRMCALRTEGLASVEEWVVTRREQWESRLEALEGVLDHRLLAEEDGDRP